MNNVKQSTLQVTDLNVFSEYIFNLLIDAYLEYILFLLHYFKLK